MRIPHPFRFGVTLLGAASRQQWIARESRMTGIPFDPAGQRVGKLEEAVEVLTGLFADGPMTFAGRSYSLNGFEVFPKPFQHPHPPLLVSGGGKRMLSIAGRFADIITLNPPVAPDGNSIDMAEATADATTQQIAWIRETAGDRFAQIEIGNFVIGGVKTERAATRSKDRGFLSVSDHWRAAAPSRHLYPGRLGGSDLRTGAVQP